MSLIAGLFLIAAVLVIITGTCTAVVVHMVIDILVNIRKERKYGKDV